MHRDLLCEAHCKEISKLGFCSNHRKLVESQGMCEDCLSSRPELEGSARNFEVFPWMKGFGVMRKGEETVGENGGVSLNCSCCGACLDDGKYSSYFLLKTPSWDVLECAQKENSAIEAGDFVVDEGFDDCDEKIPDSAGVKKVVIDGDSDVDEEKSKEDVCVSADFDELKPLKAGEDEVDVVEREKETVERERETAEEESSIPAMKDKSVQVCVEDLQFEIPPQHLEFFLDFSGNTLVPIELIDEHHSKENEGDDERNYEDYSLVSEVRVEEREALLLERERRVEEVGSFIDVDINEEPTYSMLEAMEMEEDESSLVFHARASLSEHFEMFPLAQWPSVEANEDQEMAVEEEQSGIYCILFVVSVLILVLICEDYMIC